jgi:hypothetical protein
VVAGEGDHLVLLLVMGDERECRSLRHALPSKKGTEVFGK